MTFKSTAMLSAVPDVPFKPQEYRQPPRDYTQVKCQVVRACWVTLPGETTMRTVKPGQVLQIPRWLANELASNGKASLL